MPKRKSQAQPPAADPLAPATVPDAGIHETDFARQVYRELRLVAEAAFRLERWLNPGHFPWGNDLTRPDPTIPARQRFGSPIAVIDFLWRLRETLDRLLVACDWQNFCGAEREPQIAPAVPEMPKEIVGDLDQTADHLEMELHSWPRATPNQLPKHEVREGVQLIRRLAARIRLYAREAEPKEYVTLQQAAAIVNRSKRTLERCTKKSGFPRPRVTGGGGKSNEYAWDELRPFLEREFDRALPTVFPFHRIAPQ